jgi:hypothetical protein
MFYSKYSDYLPEQIIDEGYEELCQQFISMAKDDESKRRIERNII